MNTTRNISWKWKILCAVLVIVNALTLRLLLDTRGTLSESEDWLADHRFSEAMSDAGADFLAGRLRAYEIETHEYPAVGQQLHAPKRTFTGRKDGPMEIWTLPRFRQDNREKFELRLASAYVRTYNERMRILYERRVGPKRVRVLDPTKGPPPAQAPPEGEANPIPP